MNIVDPVRDPVKIEEIKAILKHSSYRDYFMFVLGINTGLRISDMITLKVKDVQGPSIIVNGKDYPISDALRTEIMEYTKPMKKNSFLFYSQKGGHIKRGRAYEILKAAAEQAGVKNVGTHTMRKTWGYHFYKKTKDISTIQSVLGHSAPSVTLNYIGLNQDEVKEALKDMRKNFSI